MDFDSVNATLRDASAAQVVTRALALGRRFVGFEISEESALSAAERIGQGAIRVQQETAQHSEPAVGENLNR